MFVLKWENAYIKDLYAWRILMNFLCIYLGEGKGRVHLTVRGITHFSYK